MPQYIRSFTVRCGRSPYHSEKRQHVTSQRPPRRERRLALDYETKARRIADRLLTSVADNASLLDDPAWLIEALAATRPCCRSLIRWRA
ncbi:MULTISPECIES: hypothetical protein [Rhizobium]|uniref:hypothetical protein n=1 Tax=Rhizobium TaxID=379 RepID=UPI00035F2B31|nr:MULTISPECIES: hypothetical protein [Rhizobium]